MTATQQLIAQVRPKKAGTAGHKAGGHDHLAYGLCPRQGRLAGVAAGLAAALCGLAFAGTASAWSPASAIYIGARPAPLAVAGDTAGNGIGVMASSAADGPLLLLQRNAVATVPDGVAFAWNAPTPLPGGVPLFTSSTTPAVGAGAAAGAEGAGVIVVRSRVGGSDTYSALLRDSGERFGAAATIVPADFDRLSDPVVTMSAAGTAVVAFDATRASGRRAAYIARLAGNPFGRPRVLSLTGAGAITAAVGPRELGLVAWTRAGRAEISTIDDRGVAARYRVLGRAARGADIAAAGSATGGIVAWEGRSGSVRLVRRGSSTTGRFGAPVTVRAGAGADISGLTAALDDDGIAYVIWREGSGARTRILVARAKAGRRFTIDQVATGAGLGRPASVARPIGGAIVGWAAKTGWQARRVPTSGGLPIQSTVSAPGTSTDVPLTRPFVSAGPGARADMTWLQPSDGGAGYDVMQTSETDR